MNTKHCEKSGHVTCQTGRGNWAGPAQAQPQSCVRLTRNLPYHKTTVTSRLYELCLTVSRSCSWKWRTLVTIG